MRNPQDVDEGDLLSRSAPVDGDDAPDRRQAEADREAHLRDGQGHLDLTSVVPRKFISTPPT